MRAKVEDRLETVITRVEHVIRATHASTGEPITPLDATFKSDRRLGQDLKVVAGTVVITMDLRLRKLPEPGVTPPKPVVTVSVPEGPVARRLADLDRDVTLDEVVEPATPDLPLVPNEYAVAFDPVPMTLAVDLVRPGAGPAGGPSTGKTVEARASNATRIALPELAGTPGTYRSAARVWTAGFNPLDLLVGNTLVRRIAIDFARTETRVTVVDPT